MADKKNNIPLWGAVVASAVCVFVGLIRSALVLILIFPLWIFFRWHCCALPWNPPKKETCSLYCNLMICMYCGNPYSELTAVILHRLQRERRWFVQSVQTLRVNFTSGSDAFSEGFFHLPRVCVCDCIGAPCVQGNFSITLHVIPLFFASLA